MVLAIDFDHVIHNTAQPKPGRKMGEPMPGAKEAMIALWRAGHQLVVHSCNRKQVISDWMQYYEIPYHYVWDQLGKPVADRYLDDLGVTFRGWDALDVDPERWL